MNDAVELKTLPDDSSVIHRVDSISVSERPTLPTPTDTLSRVSTATEPADEGLAPMDRGKRAWLFVACATIQETLVWGFSFSFAVFQDPLRQRFPESSNVAISAIGTTTLALEYSSLIFLINLYRRYPDLVRPATFCAVALCAVSLIAASFATSVPQLIFFQGVLFGLGAGCMYAPAVLYLYQWFARRRGLAGGLIFAGTGIGGSLFPLLLGALLSSVGYSNTLRIWAGVTACGSSIAMIGLKPRLPLPPKGAPRASVIPRGLGCFATPLFASLEVTIVLQSLGYLAVTLYITPFTTSLNLSPLSGQVALALFNIAGVAGQVGIGWFSDNRPYPWVMFGSSLLCAITAFALWGLADSLALVLTFAVLFGGIGGGFSSVWSIAATDVAGDQSQHAGLVFACFALAKAVAAVAGPSIAGSLYDMTTVRSTYGQSGYQKMVFFVGSTMIATCGGSVITQVMRRTRKG